MLFPFLLQHAKYQNLVLIYNCYCVLTEMAFGDSGTASDSSNIGCTVGSFVGGAIGSLTGPAVSE